MVMKYLTVSLCVLFFCVSSIGLCGETEIVLKDSTINSGFTVKSGKATGSIARFRADGKVGIGTSEPGALLHLVGTDQNKVGIEDGKYLLLLTDPDGGTDRQKGIAFGRGDNAIIAGIQPNIPKGGGGRLDFYTSAQDDVPVRAMRIDQIGNIGIGTDDPLANLHVVGDTSIAKVLIAPDQPAGGPISASSRLTLAGDNTGDTGIALHYSSFTNTLSYIRRIDNTEKILMSINGDTESLNIGPSTIDDNTERLVVNGNIKMVQGGYVGPSSDEGIYFSKSLSGTLVGIGTTNPSNILSVNGQASKPGGGSWAVFSDARLKNIHTVYRAGLKEVLQLEPVQYNYKIDNPFNISDKGEHVGFSAQEVEEVIPEAVSKNKDGYLMLNNDPIMWAMLNAIKEQQAQIEQLKREIVKIRNGKL